MNILFLFLRLILNVTFVIYFHRLAFVLLPAPVQKHTKILMAAHETCIIVWTY